MGRHDCSENAICTDTPTSYICTCKSGYIGNGVSCLKGGGDVDVDECANGEQDCSVNAVCRNTINSFTCTCKSGYKKIGNGKTCIKEGKNFKKKLN